MRYDVLIVGGGFGGAFAARRLERVLRGRRCLIVAPENFMLFSPLLPEAASGTLEPRHAVIPLRSLLRTTELLIGETTAFDASAHKAQVTDLNGDLHHIEFEAAILSPGSIPTTFPIPGLLENAVGFKTLPDAIWLRNRVLHQIDAAAAATDPELRKALLTFTFVGGGYAGVEAIAELESLSRDAMQLYPGLDISQSRWVLIEAAATLLPGLHSELASFSLRVLRKRGIEVFLDTRLESCVDRKVVMTPPRAGPYLSETIVWTAGQRPRPVAEDWGLPVVKGGSVPVDRRMQIEGHPGLFAIGDFAAVPDPDGGLSPKTAQHALRQATVAADNAAAHLGVGKGRVYTYRNRGLAVTLGKWQGTAQVRRFTFTGPLAWWMGRSYHLLMMPTLGRKARVVSDWTLALLFPRDVSQLGRLGAPTPLER